MSWYQLTLLEEEVWDFPGDPVVKTLLSLQGEQVPSMVGSIPGQGTKMPCAMWLGWQKREGERERLTLQPRLFILLCPCFPWPTDQMQVGQQKGWTIVMVVVIILSLSPKGKLYSGIGKFVNRLRWSMREMGVSILVWFEHLCSPQFTSKWWH